MNPEFDTTFIEEAKKVKETAGKDGPVDYLALVKKQLVPQGIDIPKPVTIFEMGGIPLFTQKSISTIVAKAKAGKTTVTAWVIAQIIKTGVRVLWFDTEQGLYYSSRTQHWVLNIAGLDRSENLSFYDLKIFATGERVKMIEALISSNEFDVVVIDGSRDLVSDINNPDQATTASNDLMRWAEKYNTHIVTILHLNKGDGNARGHLGTELVNRSETVLKVTLNEDKQIIVEPEYTRNEAFAPFALARDDHGIPYLIEDWAAEGAVSSRKKDTITVHNFKPHVHFDVIEKVFSIKSNLSKQECKDNIRQFFQLYGVTFGESKSREFIAHYLQEGYIIENENVKGYDKFEKGPLSASKPVND